MNWYHFFTMMFIVSGPSAIAICGHLTVKQWRINQRIERRLRWR